LVGHLQARRAHTRRDHRGGPVRAAGWLTIGAQGQVAALSLHLQLHLGKCLGARRQLKVPAPLQQQVRSDARLGQHAERRILRGAEQVQPGQRHTLQGAACRQRALVPV
ncbi:hypothetical protein RZS08_01090, partial [Arthrospira platensis SPKY1]|nr:hypothetical protein [Arthrospira platensis SPKY1]